MKRWLRRLLYSFLLLIWVMVMSFPIVAFTLANKGQIQVGGADYRIRLFMVLDEDTEGVGIEWQRPLSSTPTCQRTSVTYITWVGEAENARYCSCEEEGNGRVPLDPAMCTN